ncbi:hypothetical protein [Geomicrobium sp. JCM 19037]|uniref:hypothetical protein n=1 Tax=Geomicrobium sp. JCM 19037 TaxID=1460634 RepID=UPI0005A8EE53|nr:hypothetical protein [Geomicrobium sp. JCM 19037]
MAIEFHENFFVKNCLNCSNEITDLKEDHTHCTECGFPIRNECTGTTKFTSGYGNNEVAHDTEDKEYALEPDTPFCPKCGTDSLFNRKGLIKVDHPKVEVSDPQPKLTDDDIPF